MTEKQMSIYANHVFGDDSLVSELNEKLGGYGLTVTRENVENGEERITIKFDTQAFKNKVGRGAGAKSKHLGIHRSLSDLKEQISNTSAQEVADSLGVSRATLYRRIKEAEAFNDDTVWF